MKHRLENICVNHELTNSGIDTLSNSISSALSSICKNRKEITRICLSAEEAMLSWQEHFGEETNCRLSISQRFRSIQIQLEIVGDRFDPTDDENLSDYGHTVLNRLNLSPSFTYSKGRNVLRYRLKTADINPLIPVIAAVALAIVCGLLGNYLPEQVRNFIATEILQNLQNSFFGILSMVALPLIFCSLITGICGIGDTATISGIGVRLIRQHFLSALLALTLVGIAIGAVFGLKIESGVGFAGNLSSFLSMIFSMIPNNVVGAFYDGNFTQVMILAIGMGVAMLMLGEKTNGVLNFIEQLQRIFDKMMCWVCKILPLGIFAIILSNVWSNSMDELLQIWKPMALIILLTTAFTIAQMCVVGLRLKVSPMKLWKKIMPATIVGVTTASSTAAYKDIVQCCHENFGIHKKMVAFGVPLGMAICSPGATMSFMGITVYAMCTTGASVTPLNFAVACVLCALLVMSTPSAPGGAASCFAIIFAQLMVPEHAVGTAILMYFMLDFYCTGINVATKSMILLARAWKEDQIDLSVLRK